MNMITVAKRVGVVVGVFTVWLSLLCGGPISIAFTAGAAVNIFNCLFP